MGISGIDMEESSELPRVVKALRVKLDVVVVVVFVFALLGLATFALLLYNGDSIRFLRGDLAQLRTGCHQLHEELRNQTASSLHEVSTLRERLEILELKVDQMWWRQQKLIASVSYPI